MADEPVISRELNSRPSTFSSQEIPSPSPENSLSLSLAAHRAYMLYRNTWDMEHLEAAMGLFQRAIDTASKPQAHLFNWLVICFTTRYQTQGKLDDLERAIAAGQEALQLVPGNHPDRAKCLNGLSLSLVLRYQCLGILSDLENAISMQQQTVELTPEDDPCKPKRLAELAGMRHFRFAQFGDLEDLEYAIAGQQRAIELVPEPNGLHNLAQAFRSRFQRLGDADDLARAIAIQCRAVELTPDRHPDMSTWLSALAALYHVRFERFGDLEDLQRAISGQQRAVDLTPDGHPEFPTRLNNLVLSLLARFEHLGDLDDLERAITVQRRAIALTPEGHHDMPRRLSNLGCLQLRRHERFGDMGDLQSAISAQHQAILLIPDGHHDYTRHLAHLGRFLKTHLRRTYNEQSFNGALSCFMRAATRFLGPPSDRLEAALCAVRLHTEFSVFCTPDSLLKAHSCIFDIVPELVWFGHSMTRRFEESQRLSGIVSAAVLAAIGTSRLVQAVEWLDAGRTFVWSQVLSLRNPADELERVHPGLARSLKHIHAQLQNSFYIPSQRDTTSAMGDHTLGTLDTNSDADRNRGLAIEYGKVLAEIRDQAGFENFMRPRKLSALLPSSTAMSGAVVFINMDPKRCDALILCPDGGLISAALPDLSLDKAETLRSRWQLYLKQYDVRQRMATHTTRTPQEHAVAIRILHHLWSWIVHPVLQALEITKSSAEHPLQHLTWCPAGPLSQLPIHAAGVYDRESGPRIYDFVVCSYTPSLSTLTRNIDALSIRRAAPSILIITQPNTPRLQPLPGATIEGKRLEKVCSESGLAVSAFDGEQGSVAAVSAVLGQHSWMHLACHGSQDVDDPLKSALALYDGPLSLSNLMSTASDNAELAFLSACQTAVGDEKIPEESMHLAAGMLAVGFKGVIATMWSIRDDDAPLVVEAYYRRLLGLRASGKLRQGETGAAYALHEATKQLRDEVGEKEFVRWAPFVHFGI